MGTRRLRRLLTVIAALVICAPAHAADTVIGFEDLADGEAVGAQYSGLGVQLDPPASLSAETNTLAHGGTKLLRATDHTCAPGSTVSFDGLFSSPRTQVGLWVHDPYANDPNAREVTMDGFDAAGNPAAHTSLSITSGLGWQQLLLVADPGKTIDHVEVYVSDGICTMLFDDLSFDAPAGAESPSVAWEDVTTTPVSVERGASASTTVSLRRKGGSTGRVNLSVSGLPAGVTAAVDPSQANGSTLRSPVKITLTGAANAPATPAPVSATLRATPVDGTAGAATPVDATFPVTVQPPNVTLAQSGPAPTDLYRGDAVTYAATLTRHSLSNGRVNLSVQAPPGVTATVSPATVDGSAPTTPVTVSASVDKAAARVPDGTLRLLATSDDPAAAPPGVPSELRIAAPVRVPQLLLTGPNPDDVVLRAGAGLTRVDTLVTPIDIPPDALVRTTTTAGATGLTVDASPASFPASAGPTLFKVGLTAQAGVATASGSRETVAATVDIPGHGTTAAFGGFNLTVVPSIRYALAARGIEVTQGVQTLGDGGCSTVPTRNFSHIESSVPYTGARLVDGDQTVARVFTSAWILTNATQIKGVTVRLEGFRGGKPIPGSPLSPIAAPAAVKPGDVGCVREADRYSRDNVFTYDLPPSFTYGNVTLRAVIQPLAPTSTGSVLDECASTFCQTMKRFTVRNVGFTRLRSPSIKPIRVFANGTGPGSADDAFRSARLLHPGDAYVWGYQGDEDISGLIYLADHKDEYSLALGSLSRRDIVEGGTFNTIKGWSQLIGDRTITAGVAPGVASDIAGVTTGSIAELPSGPFGARPVMLGNVSRPLTSVAHELGHALGRPHAGQNCPGTGPDDDQAGEPWPPDDKGQLDGVGLDLWGIAPNPNQPLTATEPYRVLVSNSPGSAAQFYDLMSYCAATVETPSATSYPNAWLSPKGWDEEVASLEAWTKKTGGTIGVARQAGKDTPVLSVGAIGRDGGAAILTVEPGSGTPTPAGVGPVLVGYGASGAEVARAGLVDETLDDSGLHSYTGRLPAAGVTRVAIVAASGTALDAKAQSAHAPTVAITAPAAGATVGGRKAVRVAWKQADADGDKLTATVEVSANDGKTWRRVYRGSAASTRLPAAYFTAARRARLRVSVNDGFRSAVAVSKRFRTRGAPAQVSIDSPTAGARVRSDAALALAGSAGTVTGQIAPKRLVWRLDGRTIARGAPATARDLPPGTHVLSLGVRGARRPGAHVKLRVTAVTPRFLKVTVPKRVARGARRVAVRVRSGVAAVARAKGRTLRLKARGHGVLRVPVARGRGPLAITLTVHALGADYRVTRAVRR